MLLELTTYLTESTVKVWDMLMSAGLVGKLVVLIPVIKRLCTIMRRFLA